MKPWINHFYKDLERTGINYFSYSFYQQDKPHLSLANSHAWMDVFLKKYADLPPVKKYIFNSRQQYLLWNEMQVDAQTRAFLEERNAVVGAKENVTLVHRIGEHVSMMTFGCPYHRDELLSFVKNNQVMIEWAFSRFHNIIYS